MNEHASFLSLKQALARTRKPPTLSAGGLMIDFILNTSPAAERAEFAGRRGMMECQFQ
jgi:hypothetical protein